MEVAPINGHRTMYVTSTHDHVYVIGAGTEAHKREFIDSSYVTAYAGNHVVAITGKGVPRHAERTVIALDAATDANAWEVVGVGAPKNSFYTSTSMPKQDTGTNTDMLLLGVFNSDWGDVP